MRFIRIFLITLVIVVAGATTVVAAPVDQGTNPPSADQLRAKQDLARQMSGIWPQLKAEVKSVKPTPRPMVRRVVPPQKQSGSPALRTKDQLVKDFLAKLAKEERDAEWNRQLNESQPKSSLEVGRAKQGSPAATPQRKP